MAQDSQGSQPETARPSFSAAADGTKIPFLPPLPDLLPEHYSSTLSDATTRVLNDTTRALNTLIEREAWRATNGYAPELLNRRIESHEAQLQGRNALIAAVPPLPTLPPPLQLMSPAIRRGEAASHADAAIVALNVLIESERIRRVREDGSESLGMLWRFVREINVQLYDVQKKLREEPESTPAPHVSQEMLDGLRRLNVDGYHGRQNRGQPVTWTALANIVQRVNTLLTYEEQRLKGAPVHDAGARLAQSAIRQVQDLADRLKTVPARLEAIERAREGSPETDIKSEPLPTLDVASLGSWSDDAAAHRAINALLSHSSAVGNEVRFLNARCNELAKELRSLKNAEPGTIGEWRPATFIELKELKAKVEALHNEVGGKGFDWHMRAVVERHNQELHALAQDGAKLKELAKAVGEALGEEDEPGESWDEVMERLVALEQFAAPWEVLLVLRQTVAPGGSASLDVLCKGLAGPDGDAKGALEAYEGAIRGVILLGLAEPIGCTREPDDLPGLSLRVPEVELTVTGLRRKPGVARETGKGGPKLRRGVSMRIDVAEYGV